MDFVHDSVHLSHGERRSAQHPYAHRRRLLEQFRLAEHRMRKQMFESIRRAIWANTLRNPEGALSRMATDGAAKIEKTQAHGSFAAQRPPCPKHTLPQQPIRGFEGIKQTGRVIDQA